MLLQKVEGNKNYRNYFRVVSLLGAPVEVYRRVLTDKLMEVTDRRVIDEQERFRFKKDSMDQILAIKIVGKDYIGNGKELVAGYMELEKKHFMRLMVKLFRRL